MSSNYIKALQVFSSCKTENQMRVAIKFFRLAFIADAKKAYKKPEFNADLNEYRTICHENEKFSTIIQMILLGHPAELLSIFIRYKNLIEEMKSKIEFGAGNEN